MQSIDRRRASALILTGLAGMAGLPGRLAARSGGSTVTPMATGLTQPWSLAFLPDGGFLVTERGGRLLRFGAEGGRPLARIDGIPKVAARGQGGLFDVVVPKDHSRTREILLSWAKPQPRGAGTALASAELSADGSRLENFRILFEMKPGSSGGRHFGGRVVELADGTLALTIGERGDRPRAQRLDRHEGKIIRVNRDGSVPRDNPFLGERHALAEIYSYGHRNPQGAALDASGRLWASEHGAKGGDEINLIEPGTNYGWPVIAYGRHYSGETIGSGTEAPGMAQPRHYWDPSIAPSGHVIHSGRMFPEWKGLHLIGSLKFGYIALMNPDKPGRGGWAEGQIKGPQTGRVRDVREAPDGSVWFLSVRSGSLFRISRASR